MTDDPKRWKDDENAPEALREFLAASQSKAPALPDALREAVLRRVPEQGLVSLSGKKSRVVPFVVAGVLALAAAALLALAMNNSPLQPAVPPPTLEHEPLDVGPDAGPDAPTLEAIEVERVCGEEDVNYACAVHVALSRTYEEVETRQAFGVAPPTCRSGYPFQRDEITQVDATHFTIAGPPSFTPQESIRVCAYEQGLLVATGSIEGQRQSPAVRVALREHHYDVFVSVQRLDDDALGVSLRRIPMEDYTGDGAVTYEDREAAVERVGCAGPPVAVWFAHAFNEAAARQDGRNALALVHREARGDEAHPPVFIACVDTALVAEHQARVENYMWPMQEAPWVLAARSVQDLPDYLQDPLPEPIRAMPAEAADCRIAAVLEVDPGWHYVEHVGIAYQRFRGAQSARADVECTEQNLAVELPATSFDMLTRDTDGVRRIAFELSVTPEGFNDMGPEGARYCDAGYQIIACVRDETGLHSLPGALGRWTQSGSACFTADTPIATPSGNAPIASLAPGMTVFAFAPETGARSETRVVRLIPRGERPILELALSNGETMHVTAEHPLFDAEASTFREAGSFAIGDVLRGLDGAFVRVISARETGESAPVFDLSVAGPHTYFANGVAAHNY